MKIKKENATPTASVLLQDDFSGRAEFGIRGQDAFQIKISTDGTNWLDAIMSDPLTARVECPNGMSVGGYEIDAQPDDTHVLNVKGVIGDIADLNTFQTTGLFHQLSNAMAANGLNYPVQKAGMLIVMTSGVMSFQTHHVWSGAGETAKKLHIRGAYNGTRGAWREV